ncbi:hypothetical protein ACT3TP_18050 [Glutamicibacter sp. AOP38-B1-38]
MRGRGRSKLRTLNPATAGLPAAALRAVATAVVGLINNWRFALPPAAIGIAVNATLIIGAASGLYLEARAARTPPTATLNS